MSFLSSNSGKKYINGSGIVDANGNCEIDFPPSPNATYWTGSITVVNSPPFAIWTVKINDLPVDILSGMQTATGIQVSYGDVLIITASNLLTAVGQTVNATFSVIESDSNNTPLIIPGQDTLFPSSPNGVLIGSSTNVSGGGGLFNLPPGTTYVVAYLTATTTPPSSITTTLSLSSPTAGGGYGETFSAHAVGGFISRVYQLPVAPATNQTIVEQLTVGGSAPAGRVTLYAFSSPQFPQNTIDQPLYATPNIGATVPAFIATLALSTSAVLIPAPPAGVFYQIDYVGVNYAPTANTSLAIQGTTSGIDYFVANVLVAAATGPPGFMFPLKIPALSEGLTAIAGAGGALANITSAYTPVPAAA